MSTRSAEWFAQGTPGSQTDGETDGRISDDIGLILQLVTCLRLQWTLHALGDLAKLAVTGESADRFLRATALYAKHAYAIAIPSVCLSVTRMDHSKTVEARIAQFSPYNSPIFLVFGR